MKCAQSINTNSGAVLTSTVPRPGFASVTPSVWNTRKASRSDERPTVHRSANSVWGGNFSPGLIRPGAARRATSRMMVAIADALRGIEVISSSARRSAARRVAGQRRDIRSRHCDPDASQAERASGAVASPAVVSCSRNRLAISGAAPCLPAEPAIGSTRCTQPYLAVASVPPLEQIVLDADLIERLSNTLMNDVHDRLGVMIEGRHWR